MRLLVCPVLGAMLIGLVGCSNSATVAGDVTVNQVPLDKGIIVFVPAGQGGTPVTGNIENGKYQVATTPGPKTVQISASKVIGKRKDSNAADAALIEITEERIPARYNSATELKFEVVGGANTKNWELELPKGKQK